MQQWKGPCSGRRGGSEAAHFIHPHTGSLGTTLQAQCQASELWVAEAGALYPLTRGQVEELEGGVLVAKASRGKFQKEGKIGLDLQET